MALTTAQKIALFEALEVPYDSSVDVPVDDFNLDALTRNASNADMQLAAKILARAAALSTDEESRLTGYLTEWDTVGTSTVSIDGGAGGLSGVSYSPDDRLRRIQSRIKVIIPVMRYREEITIAGKRSASSGGAIPVYG